MTAAIDTTPPADPLSSPRHSTPLPSSPHTHSLYSAEKAERKLTQQARLAKELAETQSKLNVLTEQSSRVKEARQAIERQRARISRSIIDHGRQLKWHNDMLKAKIQQFEDDGLYPRILTPHPPSYHCRRTGGLNTIPLPFLLTLLPLCRERVGSRRIDSVHDQP
jgi:hypothetical protein